MKSESRQWLQYAEENCRVASLCFESGLFNASLQNAQQAVEKALKALSLAVGLPLKKTHSIAELVADLRRAGAKIKLSADDIDLLDSVYLPSKYPLGSALPAFDPDRNLAQNCLVLAKRVVEDAGAGIRSGAVNCAIRSS